ncbi:MAG: hypothetical protein IKO05_00025 [Selenomonadaceae bacterium]|nr:hypothetical protein [Selenomonadaceae bacterium]
MDAEKFSVGLKGGGAAQNLFGRRKIFRRAETAAARIKNFSAQKKSF